ncbi:MAG: hypothetical protein FJ279_21340 [Planctomycetes bacterium]|nr:hypothetical protein [Planctomycetota bacterium]MBM4078837.1 hypothetical protein [Planctomycetota bacterium]
MKITRSTSVSHAYCVREFDRAKARAAATQDSAAMAEEQKRYDIHFTGAAYDTRYPVVWCGFTSFVGDFIIKPTITRGFGALTRPDTGRIYGIAGGGDATEVLAYDLKSGEVVLHGPAHDAKRNTRIFRPHELVLGPNRRLYCPETDNPHRQCYFWEIALP